MPRRTVIALALTALTVLASLSGVGYAGPDAAPGAWRKLSAPAPAWYTPELHAKVLSAGDQGVPVPPAVEIPASLTFFGIRPGQLIIVGPGNMCTSNFVFRKSGRYAIGTAGHCGNVGDPVTMLFAPRVLVNIGTVVLSTHEPDPDKPGTDFALIEIKSTMNKFVSPAMAYWGGPKRAYTGTKKPLVVKHAGWGLVVGTGGTPRVGIGTLYTPTLYRFVGAVTPGDSGSAANNGSDEALGNITHISAGFSIGGPEGNWVGTAAGTSIARIRQLVGSWRLATCSPAIPWPGYGCPRI